MVEAAILTCRWLGLRPTHPSQRYGLCLRRFFMLNLPHRQKIQGSLGVRSLLLRSILRLVRLNGLSVLRRLMDKHGLTSQDEAKRSRTAHYFWAWSGDLNCSVDREYFALRLVLEMPLSACSAIDNVMSFTWTHS